MNFRPIISLGTVCLLLAWWGAGSALWSADVQPELPKKYAITEPRAKMNAGVLPYIAQPVLSDSLRARLRKVAVSSSTPDGIPVRLDVEVTDANCAAIAATGAVIVSKVARWKTVTVEATPVELDALSLLPFVHQIALLKPPVHFNEGDAVMHTDSVRSTYSINGAGRTIGIISNTVNHTAAVGHGTVTGSVPNAFLTATTPQSKGFLPASIQVIDFGPVTSSDTDEGEAMLEEVFAIAPGATLAFAAADSNDAIMASNITSLQNHAGCTVIADDVAFLDEPFFQDGPIAQAINAFRQSGGLYFSAAGNNNDSGIMQSYVAVGGTPESYNGTTGAPTTGANFHNWGQGTSTPGFLPIAIPPGADLDFILEWNQPYMSYGLGAGSQQDFDIYLYDSASTPGHITGNIITGSNGSQGNTGAPANDPNEEFSYTNTTGSTQHYFLAVDKFQGLANAVLRILVYGDGQFTPPAGSVYGGPTSFGHCTAAGALAVAAVPFSGPGTVEPFSSKGGWGAQGIPFYFDNTGNLLPNAPQLRNKPDLTAPDGVSTSILAFSPFYGTSAATPNAAVCAELVWLVQPSNTNEQIIARLEATAGVVSSPAGAQPNAYTGYGLVNGLKAAAATVVTSVNSTSTAGTYSGGTIPITIQFSNAVNVTGTPLLLLNTVPAETATYASGSGTTTLTFNYTIVGGDAASPLEVASAAALTLNGGTIIDTFSQAAALIVPAAGASGSLSAQDHLVIAAALPTLVITNPSTATVPAITFTFTFSQPVTGFSTASITVSNATKGTFTPVSTSVYTLAVTATANGAVTASVLAGAAQNSFSYPSTAATNTCTYTAATGTTTSSSTTTATTTGITTTGTTSGSTTATTSTGTSGVTTGISSTTSSSTGTGGTTTATAGSSTASPSTSSGGGGGGGGGCGLGGLGSIVIILACSYWRRGRRFRQ